MTDHDLLQRIDEKLDGLIKQFTNHLAHHFWTKLTTLGAFLTVIGTLVVFILTK